MSRLSLPDAAWLLMENRDRPMHVAGLQLFEFPDDAPAGFIRELANQFRESTDLRPPFNWRLDRPYGRAGQFKWVTDERVDLDYHFRHSALPKPGRVRELLVLVSRLHTTLLDRHRPLWESHLIEGLRGKRFALYTKASHSMLDGVAAMRQILKSFTPDPSVRDLPPPWAIKEEPREGREKATVNPTAAALAAFGKVGSLASAARILAQQVQAARRIEAETVPFQAPESILNTRITGSRRCVGQAWDLERIRLVSKAMGGTINDVLLAMCSGALRDYLSDLDALPDKPLIANVPVSIRPQDADSDSGNAISFLLANLATHLDDPGQRFSLIKESTSRAKDRLSTMTYDELISYAILMNAPILTGTFTGRAAKGKPIFNVAISNVPGPKEQLYWNGALMQSIYPVSLIVEGQALNITQTSYAGQIHFGIIADRLALPHVQRLIDHLDDALKNLEKVAGL